MICNNNADIALFFADSFLLITVYRICNVYYHNNYLLCINSNIKYNYIKHYNFFISKEEVFYG